MKGISVTKIVFFLAGWGFFARVAWKVFHPYFSSIGTWMLVLAFLSALAVVFGVADRYWRAMDEEFRRSLYASKNGRAHVRSLACMILGLLLLYTVGLLDYLRVNGWLR